ncbi:Plant protein of unknown function (DUF247) [Abeliophyllum distichum]|uniref:Uncharacterized protein n=1 Tax=Abeliophyllum distichum TaxID=126358 RepID=A0ABD1RZF6_9LAMI
MSETKADYVTISIDTMLNSLSSAPSNLSIFKVGDHLRSINPKAYDPKIIAIGPSHHGKHHLQNMEQHKVRYLKLVLQRKDESSGARYVTAMRHLEDSGKDGTSRGSVLETPAAGDKERAGDASAVVGVQNALRRGGPLLVKQRTPV